MFARDAVRGTRGGGRYQRVFVPDARLDELEVAEAPRGRARLSALGATGKDRLQGQRGGKILSCQ